MAVITTTVIPTLQAFPFTGFVEPQAERTGLPRGELQLSSQGTSITLSGVGDTQLISIVSNLPANFGYVMVDMCMSVMTSAGGTYNFELDGEAWLTDSSTTADQTFQAQLGLHCEGIAAGVGASAGNRELATYRLVNQYKGIILPVFNNNRFVARVANLSTNDTAYSLDFAARFLQFDITQVHNARASAAIPVR